MALHKLYTFVAVKNASSSTVIYGNVSRRCEQLFCRAEMKSWPIMRMVKYSFVFTTVSSLSITLSRSIKRFAFQRETNCTTMIATSVASGITDLYNVQLSSSPRNLSRFRRTNIFNFLSLMRKKRSNRSTRFIKVRAKSLTFLLELSGA